MSEERVRDIQNDDVITNAEKMNPDEVVDKIMTSKQILKKSLDDSVSLSCLVIGIGNAGNQTVAYAAREGMNTFAINTSSRDLTDIIVDDTVPCFIVGRSGRGSGKNITKGIALFKENGRELFQSQSFIDKCQKADIIYVTSSTGGGTGPAISPEVCRILKAMFDKKLFPASGQL